MRTRIANEKNWRRLSTALDDTRHSHLRFTSSFQIADNEHMPNIETNDTPEVRAELEAAVRALFGPRDPEGMREAAERMDRMREELRRKHGEMNIAVDLIREIRNGE